MTTTALLTALLAYGPSIIPLVAKLVADIQAGKANTVVTADDLAELMRLAGLSSASINASLGIVIPPAPAPVAAV